MHAWWFSELGILKCTEFGEKKLMFNIWCMIDDSQIGDV